MLAPAAELRQDVTRLAVEIGERKLKNYPQRLAQAADCNRGENAKAAARRANRRTTQPPARAGRSTPSLGAPETLSSESNPSLGRGKDQNDGIASVLVDEGFGVRSFKVGAPDQAPVESLRS